MFLRVGVWIAGLYPVEGRERVRAGSFKVPGAYVMAKSSKREYVWLQCSETGDLNYRVSVNVQGGTPKLELLKYCPRLRKRTLHKVKRK